MNVERNTLFLRFKKKLPEPHETQGKITKQICLLCAVLVKIDHPKNVKTLVVRTLKKNYLCLSLLELCLFYQDYISAIVLVYNGYF